MTLMDQIRAKAKAANKCIVLAEGTEERTLKAADIILQEGIARLILLGNEQEIKGLAAQWCLKNIDKATIIDPVTHAKKQFYAENYPKAVVENAHIDDIIVLILGGDK